MKSQKHTAPVKASTQSFIEIESVRDDILVLKDNSCCILIKCGASNFGLLSDEEQHAMIASYASLLNSLSFPIQVLILSKKMDISLYLDYLKTKMENLTQDVLRARLSDYRDFIKNTVKKNTVLEKGFYIVIPFSPYEMGIKATAGKRYPFEYVVTRAKTTLYPKRDHVLRLLKKIGLGGVVLGEREIVELFYNLYNPLPTGRPLGQVSNYTSVISTR